MGLGHLGWGWGWLWGRGAPNTPAAISSNKKTFSPAAAAAATHGAHVGPLQLGLRVNANPPTHPSGLSMAEQSSRNFPPFCFFLHSFPLVVGLSHHNPAQGFTKETPTSSPTEWHRLSGTDFDNNDDILGGFLWGVNPCPGPGSLTSIAQIQISSSSFVFLVCIFIPSEFSP